MTENEWLTATAPDAMLAHLRRQLPSTGNERKLLFFAIGCGRLCWERMDSSSRMVVEWMERLANGQEKAARPDHLFRTFAKALGGPIEIINRIVGSAESVPGR